ncbi:MAG: biopolymer transporter ExbD [Candidatus Omnitrophica bacterium]|nr:hypothetical protein [bacterium]NUN97176.1 biopolymer transporter ExbD [Candidatus Omnitrophota bacterium]
MIRASRGRRVYPTAEINITNLVDVTMTLLVVFMIVAPMLKQGLIIELPKSPVVETITTDDKAILVECDKEGTLQVNNSLIVLSELETTIKALVDQYGKVPVHVRADRNLSYGFMMGVMGQIRAAGVETIAPELEPIEN